ncbi:MAG: beta-galactosidase, partial [Bacteroidales bacterium]|nr:beta-galactosidase [Bacteroidales bacterium]
EADRTAIRADGRDLAVVTVCLKDRKGRFVPDACEWVTLEVNGPARILGVGNGDPAWQEKERPDEPDARSFRVKTFNGLAQVLVQSDGASGEATMTVSGTGLAPSTLTLNLQ